MNADKLLEHVRAIVGVHGTAQCGIILHDFFPVDEWKEIANSEIDLIETNPQSTSVNWDADRVQNFVNHTLDECLSRYTIYDIVCRIFTSIHNHKLKFLLNYVNDMIDGMTDTDVKKCIDIVTQDIEKKFYRHTHASTEIIAHIINASYVWNTISKATGYNNGNRSEYWNIVERISVITHYDDLAITFEDHTNLVDSLEDMHDLENILDLNGFDFLELVKSVNRSNIKENNYADTPVDQILELEDNNIVVIEHNAIVKYLETKRKICNNDVGYSFTKENNITSSFVMPIRSYNKLLLTNKELVEDLVLCTCCILDGIIMDKVINGVECKVFIFKNDSFECIIQDEEYTEEKITMTHLYNDLVQVTDY